MRTRHLLCLAVLGALAVPLSAGTTSVLPPSVVGSIQDTGLDGLGDVLDTGNFRGLIRKTSSVEDRAIHEYDVSGISGAISSATFAGQVHVNNAWDNGVRTFEFVVYDGNGTAEITDFEIAATLVGTGQYHPPIDTSFDYDIDATSAVQALIAGGATYIGLRVQCSSDPNFPNILSDTLGTLEILTGGGVGTAYCFGDGLGTPCPCGNNNNGGGGGCDWGNLGFPEGGVLAATGSASLAANNTYLEAAGIENNFGIFFGANDQVNGGNGNPLNDGLRCAGGALVRLTPPTPATGNQATLPQPVQLLDVGASAGATRRYQYWFRTPGGPCASSANLTNGLEIVWTP